MFPNVIVIGAMKSGTSSLFNYLDLHPEISMSKKKETDYFIKEKNFKKTVNWYRSFFELENGDIVGEASPNYTKRHMFKGVPNRIYEFNPNAKLIYIVRDPYVRILSHYIHNYANGRESNNFEDSIKKNKNYILTSKYYYQLEPYLSKFNEESILLIVAEKMFQKTDLVLEKVFEFLGVEKSFVHPDFEKQHRSKKTKRTRRSIYKRYIRRYERYLQKIFPVDIEPILPDFLTREQEFEFPILTNSTEEFLYNELCKDFKMLKNYIDLDYEDWRIS